MLRDDADADRFAAKRRLAVMAMGQAMGIEGFYKTQDTIKKMCEDAEYIRERNSLIPEAEKFADRVVPWTAADSMDDWSARWNKAFHGRMNELARQRGLVGGKI